MKNIICIDLTKFNQDKLNEVSVKYDIKIENLLVNKENGFAKIFIDISTDMLIAYTTKKDKNNIKYTEIYGRSLMNIEPVKLVKEPLQLDMDSILEKISKFGIKSLNKSEKDFLDNLR